MAGRWLSTFLLVGILSYCSAEQQVLQEGKTVTGVLRRFSIETAVQSVLAVAQVFSSLSLGGTDCIM